MAYTFQIFITGYCPLEKIHCPEGGRIHLSSLRCYWLSEKALPWPEARDSCRGIPGGDLTAADSPELQNFIHFSFPVKDSMWIWLGGTGEGGPQQVGTLRPVHPGWWDGGGESQGFCIQMTLGTMGQWRRARCDGEYFFLCQKEIAVSLPSVDSYLIGVSVMSGVYARAQLNTLPATPDTRRLKVEMQLFPGLWFSHAGRLASVEMVVQPSPLSSLARVQILRPYCNSNQHLVPPGCSSLLNPFSCCSAVPLCNTTGGCAMGQYWCHLMEACLSVTSPCSPYDRSPAAGGHRFTLPPRYLATPPFYHLVADLPVTMSPSTELKTVHVALPDREIMVYPDDVLAIQHTRDAGAFLHCLGSDSSPDSPWRQSYLSSQGTGWGGWWEGGLASLLQGGQWVDGVVCDLRILYVDTLHSGHGRGLNIEHGDLSDYIFTETTTIPDIRALTTSPTPLLSAALKVIHPQPDEKNQIHVIINVPTLLVVKIISGHKTSSSWSAPVLQMGVPLSPSCPEEVAKSWPGCKRESYDTWFSCVTLVMPLVGAQSMNISVMNALSSQTASVTICGHEEITGLSVEPYGHLRMLVDISQSFTAKVRTGSSVKFTWVIDNMETFAYEGESYSVLLKKPANYRLWSQEILLTADVMMPLTDIKFLSVREVIAVAASHIYTITVRVDISLAVTFRWDFGDGSDQVNHTLPAPCQTLGGLVESGEKGAYVQDSLSHTYLTPDDYTLRVYVSNSYDSIGTAVTVKVRPLFIHLRISSNPLVPLVSQPLLLEASPQPSPYGIFYTWDFGDGSTAVQGFNSQVSHAFGSPGVYNVSLRANNTLNALTTWLMVEVMEQVTELTVSYNGPNELKSVTEISGKVTNGTSLIWIFYLGDGSVQRSPPGGSVSHVYKSAGTYTVDVTVSNTVSQTRQSLKVEIYGLNISKIQPTDCIETGRDMQFSAEVNGNISMQTFHWDFGDGSPLTVLRGKPAATHTFSNQGIYNLNLTVFSLFSTVSYNVTVCIEAPVSSVTVQPSKTAAAVGEEVCFNVLVFPEQPTGYQLIFRRSSSHYPITANAQKCFAYKEEGVEEVSVVASNKVSSKTAKATIVIQTPVSKLSVAHSGQNDTLTVNTMILFWIDSCSGTNFSVFWDFGDGTLVEQDKNVSHVFTTPGHFTVTATAFNAISRDSVTLEVNVLLPVSNLSLHTSQLFAAVNEEIVITAINSATSNTDYYWSVDGMNTTKEGGYQFRYVFPEPGVYQVRVLARNLVSEREAAILIEVFERIRGLHIECNSLANMKFIPTREKVLFMASLSQGSNITYNWFSMQRGINHQRTGDRERFELLVDTPGNISVQLTASNKLGEAVSHISIVAVERVMGASITTQSNIVALRKSVNISVTVVTGSDLQYLWYVNSDLSPMQTDVPFLLHTFTSLGHCFVKVSIQNFLSHSNATRELLVQEEVGEVDFLIDGKTPPFYIRTSAAVSVHGLIRKGSDLHWEWKVETSDKRHLFIDTNQSFIYTFTHTGVCNVSLNVSNGISWQTVSSGVTIQDEIRGLTLNISKFTICSEDPVIFTPLISKGSNVSFSISFSKDDLTHKQDFVDGQLITSSLEAGIHLVSLKAWNQVSSSQVTSTIVVRERIRGLQLVSCCSTALEALKELHFKTEVQSEFPVSYTWTFHLEGFEPSQATGQEVYFSSPGSGLLYIGVVVSDDVCSHTLNETATIQWPVKQVKLICQLARIFSGYPVDVFAEVDGGSNLSFHWTFGDSAEVSVIDFNTASHTYHTAGRFDITVKVFNNISHVSTQLPVEVNELQCSSPQASLVQVNSTIHRARPSYFEATVVKNCSAYKTSYLWKVFRSSDCEDNDKGFTGNMVTLSSQVNVNSLLLSLPKHALEVGQYCVVFTVSLLETPLIVHQKTKVTVVHSPLVAIIKGGSHRMWPSHSDVVLDGSESHDPSMEPGEEDQLQYHWDLKTEISVCEAAVFPVTVDCVSCSVFSSAHHVSYANPVVLSGHCGQCNDHAQYKWSAEDQSGLTLDLDEVTTLTGGRSPDLVVRSQLLQDGQSYTFTLNVSRPDIGRWGSASLTVLPNHPPHAGSCDLSLETDVRLLETVVTYNCCGWRDDDMEASQLIYILQVAPCHPSFIACPLLTLYRGTRSTFGTLVPVGSHRQEGDMSDITVTLLVEDHLGAKVVALNRTLTVQQPASAQVSSQWLKNKSQTEMLALVQHGNPQEIISFCIALTSHLNQMKSGGSVPEVRDRREIRGNVTRALASLPVSSLQDVDQLSSALAQSTAVPDEVVCEGCQERVVEAVGKMIHVMEEQTSAGIVPAADTGRNILNVIGGTLAAVSETVSTSSSHSAFSSTLQKTSETTLSALGYAGALMHSLMRSRVRGEEPLSLFTPHINTTGFHGKPSKLLCTQNNTTDPKLFDQRQMRPTSPSTNERSETGILCQFHIPPSLAAQLNSQNSGVVQILLGMDTGSKSSPLLTAADPPISTTLAAMEFTTPQGQPIPIRNLDPELAIRVTLPNRHPVDMGYRGFGPGYRAWKGSAAEDDNGTSSFGLTQTTLPTEGWLNFTVKVVDGLDDNAGLYICFSFSLAPGAVPVESGHIRIEVNTAPSGAGAAQGTLVRELNLSISTQTDFTEETVFLSPISLCQYYSVKERRWSSEGLSPLEGSTIHTAHCLTRHLTLFGASLFVHPGAVVLLPPSAGPARNMVVGIVCAVLVLIHLLLGIIAHKLDHLDGLRLSQVPLCGRPGLYHYRVLVKTGWWRGAGTSAHVGISLYGVTKSGSRHLQRDGAFQRGSLDQFHLETDDNLGEVWKIRIWHDNTGLDPSWYLQHVVVWDSQTDHMFFFLVEDWLSVENEKNGTVEKEVLASCPGELSQFRRVLSSQLQFGMRDSHFWLSLWERPTHSCLTRARRVMCSAVLLHFYLAMGALWYGAVGAVGQSGPASAQVLVNAETVAVGMTVAALVFPLQCLLCFLFRKAQSQVAADRSAPPSPVCPSVEIDVCLGQSELSGPSFLSLPDSFGPERDSPSSLLGSGAFDSGILKFWTASGLAPDTDRASRDGGMVGWPSCDSLLEFFAGPSSAPEASEASSAPGPMRLLRRRKALMHLRLASPCSFNSPATPFAFPTGPNQSTSPPTCCFSTAISNALPFTAPPGQARHNLSTELNHNLTTTVLTVSEENLLRSIAAAADTAEVTNSTSTSDSGRYSPRTDSSLSNTQSSFCSSWSEQSTDKGGYGTEIHKSSTPSVSSLDGMGLYKCPSTLSIDSVASTFLPSPCPESVRSLSATRIGVARRQPSWLLPPWALCVIYLLAAMLLGACLAVVGLYGIHFSQKVVLMWLISALSAILTSALLLEPLKVCAWALVYTVLWWPVDPEVEDVLAQEATVMRAAGEQGGSVRPPCGYGLLQAKEEARKVRALRSLMKHCVCQLLFLLLVLMVNYQDSVEEEQGRLLLSAVRRHLHAAPGGTPNLTSLRGWSDAWQWMDHTLVPHLHQNPMLHLVGLPSLRYTHAAAGKKNVILGNSSAMTRQLLADLHTADWTLTRFKFLSIDFTHYHRETGLFVCVLLQLEEAQNHRVTPSLSIHLLVIPPSSSGPDLHGVLAVILLIAGLLMLTGEFWAMATECAQYIHQGWRWYQLLLVLLSVVTATQQLCSLSQATSCLHQPLLHSKLFHSVSIYSTVASNPEVCAEVGDYWQSPAQSLGRAVGPDSPSAAAAAALRSHRKHVSGFQSLHQAGISVLSILRGRLVLQRLCRAHPVLGPLYGLLLMGGGLWLLARLCGSVLIRTYRALQAEMYRPAMDPQDYEMVEFFIKRLRLWMGLTKAKEFRHRVKFEGMDASPSRSSQESRLSTISPVLPVSRSPSLSSCLPSPLPHSSALSVRSEDLSVSEPEFNVQPYLDRLEPCVNDLLSRFDRINQIAEDLHSLEVKLDEAQERRRKRRSSSQHEVGGRLAVTKEAKGLKGGREGEIGNRKTGQLSPRPRISLPSSFSFTPSAVLSFPSALGSISSRTQNSYSESTLLQTHPSETSDPVPGSHSLGLGSYRPPGFGRIHRRRAWHSGSSQSADVAHRACQALDGVGGYGAGGRDSGATTQARPRSEEGLRRCIIDGAPVKRKAWISEGPDSEQD
ncbi:polycystin-1 [Lampris incognitus]|uniref:polycystin-1 n=1 Tax=Lampris incognitus TaxID=2546036 RepID=UPI0024B55E13|nr:polycystin-1 [Lampris incognitus]